jgi:hypothetical protein
MSIVRFNARLFEEQVLFLRREAERRGLSENAILRSQLVARGHLSGWTAPEAKARDDLAEGYVLSKVGQDRFVIRCGERPSLLKAR